MLNDACGFLPAAILGIQFVEIRHLSYRAHLAQIFLLLNRML